MFINSIPRFLHERVSGVVDTRDNLLRISADYVRKQRSSFFIPEFSQDNIWRGASEIVIKFVYTSPNALSILEVFRTANPTYVAVVSWKPTSETIVRYKLWEDVDEILYAPLYTGQAIPSTFFIEIWNVYSARTEFGGDELMISLMTLPTDKCCGETINTNQLSVVTCTDVIFDFGTEIPIVTEDDLGIITEDGEQIILE